MSITQEQHDNVLSWAAALRSGEFEQGRGLLKYKTATSGWEFCCMGVACEHFGVQEEKSAPGEDGVLLVSGFFNNTHYPDENWFFEQFGLDTHAINLLGIMNDEHLSSFHAIANVLEAWADDGGDEPLAYFVPTNDE